MTDRIPVRERVEKALKDKNRAQAMRLAATRTAHADPTGARFMRQDADQLEAGADAELSRWSHTTSVAEIGNGGELRPLPEPSTATIAEYVSEPADMLAHSASTQRMELAAGPDVLALALDTANSIKARDSIERMLTGQAAAAHKLAMRFMARADHQLSQFHSGYWVTHSVEAARLANAAARAMEAFNGAVLTIQRRRSGGRQVVQVIHQQVAVGAGGKAIVAGSVKGRSKPRGKRKGGR